MKLVLSGLIIAFALRQCAGAIGADFPSSFDADIKPLFTDRCVKCHGPAKKEGGLDLSSSYSVAQGGETGAAIQPRNLAGSKVWERVSVGEMPPDEPLSANEQSVLKNWILSDAPGLPDPNRLDVEAGEHWAFRLLQVPRLPRVQNDSRICTGIDRFIQSALEEQGLGLGAEADRSTLIRRVCFDLTGLPPTPAEISAFLSDSSPDAYQRMVESFLASSRYGEYWGKRWLEIAGYADSNGYFDVDSERPLAFRYRDYVIRSLNADKGFDRFVREQLAGDELSGFRPGIECTPEMVELLEATHFLRNAQDGTGESGENPNERLQDRHAVLEASLEIFGSALFGMTLQCAKCHDHKFEPVTQRDYFGLMAILTPAFNVDHWLHPNERYVHAALPEELASFTRALKRGKATESDRPGKIASVQDVSAVAPSLYIPERGNYDVPGLKAEPSGLRILSEAVNPFSIRQPFPRAKSSGYRLAFAEWLTRNGSRPAALLARLHVNRIWQQHFGKGLSTTPANFGYSGNAPTHPELLEWLTDQFIKSGWNLKSLHRLILTSKVYRQSSALDSDGYRCDPENHLLWRMPLRRLDAEAIRDSLLAVSGDLDLRMGGPPYPGAVRTNEGEVVVYDTAPRGKRRSVYLPQRRTQVLTLLQVFDSPSIVTNCVERIASTVPLQSLTLLNSEFMLNRSASLARRLAQEAGPGSDARIIHAFILAYAREPDAEELRSSVLFLRNQTKQYLGHSPVPQQRAWADFSHTLLASNEFLYID